MKLYSNQLFIEAMFKIFNFNFTKKKKINNFNLCHFSVLFLNISVYRHIINLILLKRN